MLWARNTPARDVDLAQFVCLYHTAAASWVEKFGGRKLQISATRDTGVHRFNFFALNSPKDGTFQPELWYL